MLLTGRPPTSSNCRFPAGIPRSGTTTSSLRPCPRAFSPVSTLPLSGSASTTMTARERPLTTLLRAKKFWRLG